MSKNNIAQSVFEKHYEQLSESKQDLLNQKYNCSICLELIKYENPYLCYVCQKLFHHECLKNWDKRQKQQHKNLSCPNCRNELPFEKWKEKLNHEENRTNEAVMLNQIGRNFNQNEFTKKSLSLFKIILNKLNTIHSLIQSQKNNNLNNLIDEFKSDLSNPPIDEISNVIIEELEFIEKYIGNSANSIKKEKSKIYKKEINLKYIPKYEGQVNIFGEEFVKNNFDNISLIINGQKSSLVSKCHLKEGENNVTLCIKNKLTNLSCMFSNCEALSNIDELQFLNTENVTDFSFMFSGLYNDYNKKLDFKPLENLDVSKATKLRYTFSLSVNLRDLKPLRNWNVSKCEDFTGLFQSCSNITDLIYIQNWNVSNATSFSQMLEGCSSLKNLNGLENWDVSNVTDFSFMFSGTKLNDLNPLKDWNVLNGNFASMFHNCCSLKNLNGLENWNVSNSNCFIGMFNGCKFLSNINSLENWDVSKGDRFSEMFKRTKISSLNTFEKWNVSNGTNFHSMFYECKLITDLKPLKNWNVSKGTDFSEMFCGCDSLLDLKPIENWNVSKGKDFTKMFSSCNSLKNRNSLQKWKFEDNAHFKSMFN